MNPGNDDIGSGIEIKCWWCSDDKWWLIRAKYNEEVTDKMCDSWFIGIEIHYYCYEKINALIIGLDF